MQPLKNRAVGLHELRWEDACDRPTGEKAPSEKTACLG